MNTVTTRIFLAHTPLQVFFVEKIIEQEKPQKGIYILISSVVPANPNLFDKCILIPKKNGLLKLVKTFKAKLLLKKHTANNNASLFISHTSALLDNYVYYSLKRQQPDLSVNFFYDGILYFYDYQEKYGKTHNIRKLIGFLVGINYHFEPRIVPFDLIDNGLIYTILSEFTLGDKGRHVEIELQKKGYSTIKNNVLILGGKPSLLSHSEVREIYARIIRLISNVQNSTVFFKGHHADFSENFKIANNDNMPFKDITQSNPIEEVVEKYAPSKIYSYPSSALINLKAMYGNEIDIYCFYTKKKKEDLSKLLPIFEHMGINIDLI